ncbi:MAG: ornithine carbamoyltransferase [Candidatus Marsarchaeota archaeon]|jgi:ornithine carbamoyltransferase|nr:ornithine carbamoyltransferase [Candidatus Marsarchaeota archaeon]
MHFLSSNDFSKSDIEHVFSLADRFLEGNYAFVDGGTTLALLFEKPSTRTRVSFETAMIQLGGVPIYIDASTSQLSRGESIGDTARVLSSYVDMIAARMHRQSDLAEFAKHSEAPVINALTDLEHPCQALGDLYTIREAKGRLDGIRIAFVGDIAANTANSLMVSGARVGAEIVLVGPEGYKPNAGYVAMARKEGEVMISDDPRRSLKDADVIYTDTFVSMGEEKEAGRRRKLFADYQVNARLVGYAKAGAAVMHCLPAHRGEEITTDVLDGEQSLVWKQAKNKLLIEKAIMLYLYKNRRKELGYP